MNSRCFKCVFTCNKIFFLYVLCITFTKRTINGLESSTIKYRSFRNNLNDNATIFPLEESALSLSKKFKYQKCDCGIQEINTNGNCISVSTGVVIPLLQNIFPESDVLFDFFLSDVQAIVPNCSSPKVLLDLKGNLYILENGELYIEGVDMVFFKEDYCFELSDEEGIIKTTAKVCFPKPKIPFCAGKESNTKIPLDIFFGNDVLTLQTFEKLETQGPICTENKNLLTLPFNPEEDKFSLHYISKSTQLFWQPSPNITTEPELLLEDEYCLQISSNKPPSYLVKLCHIDPLAKHQKLCQNSTCVRKCCPIHEIYNSLERKCLPYGHHINSSFPPFYNYEQKTFVPTPDDLLVEYSFPLCIPEHVYLVDPKANVDDDFFLLQNGSLHMTLSKLTVPASLYCLDSFLEEDQSLTFKAISCFLQDVEEEVNHCKNVIRILYPVLIIISCLFLFITLIVYSLVPELHAKLHGKCLMSHVSSLLAAFICQLILFWGSKSLSMTGCKIIALGNQVSFLWAFFWLNVMCFDIWWTLKSMSLVPETGESCRRRFALYSLYAWGCPLLISAVTTILEFLPKDVDKDGLILPGFGVRECWFQDKTSTWIYFHGFTLTLYVLNIFFFFHVAAILIKGQRSTEGILRTTKKQHRERVYLYLKLFVVMGITWICEVASWQEGTCVYWIFTDIINSLQGVMIFCIFMCNRKVFQKLQAKGIPLFSRMKACVQFSSSNDQGKGGGGATNSSSTQRTMQTSDETSSRRLSNSIPPIDSQLIKK